MSTVAPDAFESMIREAGEGHLIDWHAPRAEALACLRDCLRLADERAAQRLGVRAPQLTPDRLEEEHRRNPHKVRAFLQVLKSASPEMLVMVWRILQGMAVAGMELEYQADASRFRLCVRLSPPHQPDQLEEYESTDINDAVVLRHLGILKMDDRPVFDGFYALNLAGS